MKIVSNRGFSLVEMSIVMIVVGSLLAISFPYLKNFSMDSKRHSANDSLDDAMKGLLGYAYANGAFPDWPDDGGGADIVNQLPTAKLGLASKSAHGDIIYYDVNPALQFADETDEAAGQSQTDFCNAILAEQAKVVSASTADDPEPRVCNGLTSCDPATVADQTSVAITLISRSRNRTLDENNGDGDGVYENSDRGADDAYDDIVKTISIAEISNYYGCGSGGVGGTWGTPWGGGTALSCGVNMSIAIVNNASIDMYVQQTNEVCWVVTAGHYIAFCQILNWGGAGSIGDINISTNDDCTAPFYTHTPAIGSDTSGDGEILYNCTEGPYACTFD